MDSTGRLADTLVAECSRKVMIIMVVEEEDDHSDQESNHDYDKVDKTELDDIRSGMEKERCKINYFQVLENFHQSLDGCLPIDDRTPNLDCFFCSGQDSSHCKSGGSSED